MFRNSGQKPSLVINLSVIKICVNAQVFIDTASLPENCNIRCFMFPPAFRKAARCWHTTPHSFNSQWIGARFALGFNWRRKWCSPDQAYPSYGETAPEKHTQTYTHYSGHVTGHTLSTWCFTNNQKTFCFDSTANLFYSWSVRSWLYLKVADPWVVTVRYISGCHL